MLLRRVFAIDVLKRDACSELLNRYQAGFQKPHFIFPKLFLSSEPKACLEPPNYQILRGGKQN